MHEKSLRGISLVALLCCVSIVANTRAANAEVDAQVHEKCLKAADYTGCVKTQTYGAQSPNNTIEVCDKFDWCLAQKGQDSLGMPKVDGWKYKTLANGDVKYEEIASEKVGPDGAFTSLWHAIPHKGERRYVGLRSVRHSYDSGAAGRPGYRQSFGPSRTSCSGYDSGGLATVFCNTTPPISTYIPGTSGRPAGMVREFLVTVFDCKDRTRAIYTIGGGLWQDWIKLSQYDYMPTACKELDTLEPLPMQL